MTTSEPFMRSFFLFPLLAVLGVATPLYEVVILNHRPSTTALSSNGHYATGNFTPYVVHQPTGITSFLSSVTGTTWLDALGVNSSGVVVGQSMNSRALIWDGTTLQTYLPGTSVQSVAWGINDAGMIVGAALIPGGGGGWRLFRYDRATNTVEIRSEESAGYAINAAG